MTDTTHPKNGNILCAQISMTIHDVSCAITCRYSSIHVQSYSGSIFQITLTHWRMYTFEQLLAYIEARTNKEELIENTVERGF